MRLLAEDGREGWGEIAPLPGFSPETLDQALAQARSIAGEIQEITGLESCLQRPDLSASVRAGFALAWWQLAFAHQWNAGNSIRLQGLLQGPPDQIMQDARAAANTGITAVKVKVGQRPIEDEIRLIHEVSTVIPNVKLRIDANRAWQLTEAKRFIDAVANLNVDYLEEPVKRSADLLSLIPGSAIPIALDETVRHKGADVILDLAQVFVVKPSLMGGLFLANELIEQSLEAGKRCVISSSWESGIGMFSLLHMASNMPQESHGLDTYRYLANDALVNRLPLSQAKIRLPSRLPELQDIDWQYVTLA